jgi:hypothetical protein
MLLAQRPDVLSAVRMDVMKAAGLSFIVNENI